jgi:hypothetical protein
MCEPGDGFGGRESISNFSHTKSFLGICTTAREGRGAVGGLNQGRWVYEGEEKKDREQEFGGRWRRRLPASRLGVGSLRNQRMLRADLLKPQCQPTAASASARDVRLVRAPVAPEGADGDEGSRTLSHIITGR